MGGPEGLGVGQGVRSSPGKSGVAIDFLRNTDTDAPREAIRPLGSNGLSREVRTPSVKYIDALKTKIKTL